jgi:CheY-like chemotaxis protein
MSSDPEISTWKVLIVDDDLDNLGVAAEYLQFIGATVQTAKDGQEGMQALDTFTPTVILLDLSMPNMDGWQMFKKVRDNPETASIPIIALTAHAMPEDRKRAVEAGFDGYITKPFMLDSLVREIKHWFAQAQASRDDPGSREGDKR